MGLLLRISALSTLRTSNTSGTSFPVRLYHLKSGKDKQRKLGSSTGYGERLMAIQTSPEMSFLIKVCHLPSLCTPVSFMYSDPHTESDASDALKVSVFFGRFFPFQSLLTLTEIRCQRS